MLGWVHILSILVIGISFTTIPAFAGGYYENELYNFSFNAPLNWLYIENHPIPDGTTLQVVLFPQEFDEGFTVYNSPNISVFFENIPESKIPTLNAKTIEEYEQEVIRTKLPNAKIINYEIKSTPYGWETNAEIVVSLNIPFIVRGDYHSDGKAFYFKDSRESYTVDYLSPVEYYDNYHSIFEDVTETMVIQGVVVPEFHELVLMVLGSSIVFVIILARKIGNSLP